MSENNKKICLGCMQEINTDDIKCPHCGYCSSCIEHFAHFLKRQIKYSFKNAEIDKKVTEMRFYGNGKTTLEAGKYAVSPAGGHGEPG